MSREERRAFDKWLAESSTTSLTCRINGHWWEGYDALAKEDRIGRRPGGQYVLDMTCRRECGVRRQSYLTSTWRPSTSGNSYSYPAGYQMPESLGAGWMDAEKRALIRHELHRRAKGDGE